MSDALCSDGKGLGQKGLQWNAMMARQSVLRVGLQISISALLGVFLLHPVSLMRWPAANGNGRRLIFYLFLGNVCDELQLAFPKMHEFSTVDGFVEISESLAEMIKYMANEPSVGLFFIQQHTQHAVPNVIKLKSNVVDKSHETTLHTEDFEDSIAMLRSMKECGFSIADEMIGDIKKSLVTMTTKQPKRGKIQPSTTDCQTARASNSWGNTQFYNTLEGSERGVNYFSSVLKSAKQKASSLKWPPSSSLVTTSASTGSSSVQCMEKDELPLSSQVEDECQNVETVIGDDGEVGNKLLLSVSEKYDDFKADKEAKLEEWLEGKRAGIGDAEAER
ncbi:BLOC-1-related complex subunit 8-like protein isoform X3 [Senna tora]|uniref:BLOC-1-related complex subunit 8-like protein isoform X3 n=1 Tax=Senna tora TaxID=362788 RepID=A0A834SZC3_9FABA|nr:BLOC-1-related complex subunit 8-like protein isoform X3 [Senna tora]